MQNIFLNGGKIQQFKNIIMVVAGVWIKHMCDYCAYRVVVVMIVWPCLALGLVGSDLICCLDGK